MAPPNPVPYSIYYTLLTHKKLWKLGDDDDDEPFWLSYESVGMVPGNQLECGLLEGRWKHAESSFTFHEKGQKMPKEDTEHEIQTSDKLIWCFRVLRASPAEATATTRRGVSHCGLPIYIKKYLKANKELSKLKYFTIQKYT